MHDESKIEMIAPISWVLGLHGEKNHKAQHTCSFLVWREASRGQGSSAQSAFAQSAGTVLE